MCKNCKKDNCSCIPAGPIGPQGPQGKPGQNGNDGVGIRQSYISDGVTPIGNNIYPINTLVFQLTNLSYISSGTVYSAVEPDLDWIDLIMENGVTPGTGTGTPRYAISNGFLHLRGQIDASTLIGSAAYFTFSRIPANTFTDLVTTSISPKKTPTTVNEFDVLVNGELKIRQGGTEIWMLDTVVPISIR